MKQKPKSELFTSRPEPPALDQIARDIFLAGEDDPVFDVLKRSRSGIENGSSECETNLHCLDQASDFMKKMKQLENLEYLRDIAKELHDLSSQLSGANDVCNGLENIQNSSDVNENDTSCSIEDV